MQKFSILFLASLVLTSCSGWFDSQEEEFKKQCYEGIDRGYKNAGNYNYNEEKVDQICDCALEKVKKDHSFESFTMLTGAEKNEYLKACFEEVFNVNLDAKVD